MSIKKQLIIEGQGALNFSNCHKKVVADFEIEDNYMNCTFTSSTKTSGNYNPYAQLQMYINGVKVYDSGYTDSSFPHTNTTITFNNVAVPSDDFTIELRLGVSIGYDDNATNSGKYKKSLTITREIVSDNDKVYIYLSNGEIHATDFIVSNKFYINNDGKIYAPSFNIADYISLDPSGITATKFVKI